MKAHSFKAEFYRPDTGYLIVAILLIWACILVPAFAHDASAPQEIQGKNPRLEHHWNQMEVDGKYHYHQWCYDAFGKQDGAFQEGWRVDELPKLQLPPKKETPLPELEPETEPETEPEVVDPCDMPIGAHHHSPAWYGEHTHDCSAHVHVKAIIVDPKTEVVDPPVEDPKLELKPELEPEPEAEETPELPDVVPMPPDIPVYVKAPERGQPIVYVEQSPEVIDVSEVSPVGPTLRCPPRQNALKIISVMELRQPKRLVVKLRNTSRYFIGLRECFEIVLYDADGNDKAHSHFSPRTYITPQKSAKEAHADTTIYLAPYRHFKKIDYQADTVLLDERAAFAVRFQYVYPNSYTASVDIKVGYNPGDVLVLLFDEEEVSRYPEAIAMSPRHIRTLTTTWGAMKR